MIKDRIKQIILRNIRVHFPSDGNSWRIVGRENAVQQIVDLWDAQEKSFGAQKKIILDENEALRNVLHELYATVQGECPSLLSEDSGGDALLALKIEELLNKDSSACS